MFQIFFLNIKGKGNKDSAPAPPQINMKMFTLGLAEGERDYLLNRLTLVRVYGARRQLLF